MIDPNHQTWRHESTTKLGRLGHSARLVCVRSRAVERADDVHEIVAEVMMLKGQGWSVRFTLPRGVDRDGEARAAAAAAYLAAWAFSRTASVREDGNPYSIDIDTSKIPGGVVSFGENDLEYIDGYFGIPDDALRRPPKVRQ